MLSRLVTLSAFLFAPTAFAQADGTWLDLSAGIVGGDGCVMPTVGVVLGHQLELPLAPEAPEQLALFVRPGVAAKLVPCPGLFVGGTLKAGLRGGPIQFGPYAEFGPAVSFHGGKPAAHVNVGVALDLIFKDMELGLHSGVSNGYGAIGWVDLGVSIGARF